jgi:hypothetical protein
VRGHETPEQAFANIVEEDAEMGAEIELECEERLCKQGASADHCKRFR